MSVFWSLVALLGMALLGTVIFVAGHFFSEDRELVRAAEEKLEHGREEEAVSILSRATELNPANFKARWRLAKLLQMMSQYESAAFHFEYCLEKDELPAHVRMQDALVRLAEVYEQQGHHEEAADTWSRYLQQEPNRVEGYYRRALMFHQIGNYERALADLKHIRTEFGEDEQPETVPLFVGRCYLRLNQAEKAYSYFEEYLEAKPNDLEAAIEAASAAKEAQEYDQARQMYEHVRSESSGKLFYDATLRIIRLALQQNEEGDIESLLDALYQAQREQELTERQELHTKYLEAKWLERTDQQQRAMDNYWEIFKKEPDFLDVPEIIDEEIGRMDPDDLLDEFMNTGRQRFSEQARQVVELMGYEVMKTEDYGLYEVNVSAREAGQGLKADRILITFKRWESKVGEWPLREFELQLLENRYDRGIFVAPHGFKKQAREYADAGTIRLIGPDTLIEYLREAYKHTL